MGNKEGKSEEEVFIRYENQSNYRAIYLTNIPHTQLGKSSYINSHVLFGTVFDLVGVRNVASVRVWPKNEGRIGMLR